MLGVTSDVCLRRFKNLKDTFTKTKNQIRDSMRSGAGAKDVPLVKWRYFEAMTPIMEVVQREPIAPTETAGRQDAEFSPGDDLQDWPVPDMSESPVDAADQEESADKTTGR
ncbi:hypothetical protein MTO96_022509 [Rhipicephalus appendiculatus]